MSSGSPASKAASSNFAYNSSMTSNRRSFLLRAAVSGLAAGAAAAHVAADDKKGKNAKHDCAGKNECKGLGGCKSGDNGCAGKNSCKGKGGCSTAMAKKDDKKKKS